MTGAVPPELAMRLARECRDAADVLLRLQDTLAVSISRLDPSAPLVRELQALDTVAQTIADMGAVFTAISTSPPVNEIPSCRTESLLAQVSQTSLRCRLAAAAPESSEGTGAGGVDLF